MDAGLLPKIKCSNCGMSVEISAMGDHVCAKTTPAIPSPSQSPPPPPPKSDNVLPSRSPSDALASKAGRSGPPPRIDPAMANRPFLNPGSPIADHDPLIPSPLSTSTGVRSPFRALQRSHTSPLPDEPQSPDSINLETAFASFPLPRSMSDRRPGGMLDVKSAKAEPPIPSPRFGNALNRADGRADDVPPPPLPKDDPPSIGMSAMHRYGASMDSKSSYRTSLASTRYGDNRNSKRSTSMSSRRPSFGSVAHDPYKYLDDAPPVPSAAPQALLHPSRISQSSVAEVADKREGRGEIYSGFDFGVSERPTSARAEIDHVHAGSLRVSSHSGSDRLSGSRGSAELFFQSPAQSAYGPPVDFELPEEPLASPATPANGEYKAFKPSSSEFLQPADAESARPNERETNQRKDSDSASEGNISVSNFARALGLDVPESNVNNSITSSDSSPSETRSGTSLSSLPSEASMSRRKPSDQGRLGLVVEELQGAKKPQEAVLEHAVTESPTALEPPRMPETLFSPDSPTDPAISQGSLSLISEKIPRSPEQSPRPPVRSATAPVPRPAPRPKGPCRGCGDMIMGKSVSSADGRLTGRYHRACFVCHQCRTPFQTADFYVLEDRPYCAQHYHERNGSLCQTCHTGIEGQYQETVERRGRGPADRQKFHPDCLKCRTCQIPLKGEYFEWYGQVYCERDARRAAAATPPPPRPHRPTMPSSPLAPSMRGYPPPPGYPGPGPAPGPGPGRGRGRGGLRPPGPMDGPYAATGPLPPARRFPERRTTKLMMI
ncbi:hypothetical protein BO94DRAFT_462438 [Aspergillus sclerotioniger CBS 115572]|uniref:LIM zinc-binding domain-containing protein n=1 Tax=Aspergillus sclerotioniger CBS 115572 TaxID=1450535 RepID=A0A317WY07_9EURO|nr:hypothetical protein BO94DRAFT_462438 [Aspergillus sclerotioniger CBS 115572]PWY91316.1 hypothetical protein BO94DRAFT_462438 [Aspergillus sclerotioniger CBS 115572]